MSNKPMIFLAKFYLDYETHGEILQDVEVILAYDMASAVKQFGAIVEIEPDKFNQSGSKLVALSGKFDAWVIEHSVTVRNFTRIKIDL